MLLFFCIIILPYLCKTERMYAFMIVIVFCFFLPCLCYGECTVLLYVSLFCLIIATEKKYALLF